MYVDVTRDPAGGSVTLADEDDLTKFSVRIVDGTAPEMIARCLTLADAGHLDGDDAVIEVSWLRRCTSHRPRSWQTDFDRMLAYAASMGWMDATGTSVKAHIESLR